MDGLYRVTPSVGEPVLTHGPDTRAASESREAAAGARRHGLRRGRVERQPVCATDFYQQVIYASTDGRPHRLAAATAQIRAVIAAHGRGAQLRVARQRWARRRLQDALRRLRAGRASTR